MSSTQLLVLPSDTPCYTAIDKSDASFHPNGIILSHKLRTPTSGRDNSPFINCQLFPDGSNVTSPTDASDGELQVNDVDSNVDEDVPRKRQKTQTGSNAQITISNVLVKSGDKKSTIVDGIPALSQKARVNEGKEENSASTHDRKRLNGQSGLLASRPLAMSTSTSISDSSDSGVLKDREEPLRKTRGSYGTKLKKSQGRIADQDELELWTNADVAHIGFRKTDELGLLDKLEEESTKRNLSHTLTYLMEMEAMQETIGQKRTSKAQEWTKMVQNQAVDGLEGQEDEETGDDVNSPNVPLPQLEDWSTTLRSLLKGKKKFQHQDLIDLKGALQDIYNNRANISATSSLAHDVYEVTQLEIHDVPNQDELKLRSLARKSTQYWGIGRQGDA